VEIKVEEMAVCSVVCSEAAEASKHQLHPRELGRHQAERLQAVLLQQRGALPVP